MEVDVAAVKELVRKWNAAHSRDRVDELLSLYADNVVFYGSALTAQQCVAKKKTTIGIGSFQQTIEGDLLLSAYEKGVVRGDVVTVVTRGGKSVENESYLIVRAINGEYRIVEESDFATDQRTGNYPYHGAMVNIIDTPLRKTSAPTRATSAYFFGWILIVVSIILAIVLLS